MVLFLICNIYSLLKDARLSIAYPLHTYIQNTTQTSSTVGQLNTNREYFCGAVELLVVETKNKNSFFN